MLLFRIHPITTFVLRFQVNFGGFQVKARTPLAKARAFSGEQAGWRMPSGTRGGRLENRRRRYICRFRFDS